MNVSNAIDRPTIQSQKLLLIVGYLALASGILTAYTDPTTDYEISIYSATPAGFWLGLAVVLLIAVFVSLSAPKGYVSLAGLGLGGSAIVALAGLPIIRGYFFYGSGDGLTHLGWTKDLFTGAMSAFGDFYPGIHTLSLFMHGVIGGTIPRAMLFAVLACVVVYLVFIPLCVRAMTARRGAMMLAGLAGLLLLPINHLGMNYMTPHPITDSILLTPVILYVLINYLTAPDQLFERRLPISAVGAMFVIVLSGIVLYHSQQAANLIIFFGTISAVQFIYRSIRPNSRVADHRTVYGPTAVLIGAIMLWSVGRSRFDDTVDAVLRELFSFLRGGAGFGAGSASQGNSLAAAGGSLPEIFIKLFGVSAVFVALAGVVMITSVFGRSRDASDTTVLIRYFTAGLVVLVPYSLVFYIGSISGLFFRNLGLIMVFSTILGSIALDRYLPKLTEFVSMSTVRTATGVVMVVMLVLSVVVVYPSPYLFLPNDQVTETQMDGYRYAFEHTEQDLAIYSLREGPWRYKQGLFGVENTNARKYGLGIPETNLSSLAGRTAKDRYLILTEAARKREVAVYEGVRYDRRNLSTLSSQSGVSLVFSNGAVDLYRIEGSGPAEVNASSPNPTEVG